MVKQSQKAAGEAQPETESAGEVYGFYRSDVPKESAWELIPRALIFSTGRTEDGCWMVWPKLDEYAVAKTEKEAARALWDSLTKYLESLQSREAELSDSLKRDLQVLRAAMRRKHGGHH